MQLTAPQKIKFLKLVKPIEINIFHDYPKNLTLILWYFNEPVNRKGRR